MDKQQRLVLWISILASFVAFLDGSVVNVGLPAITRELGGGLIIQQWVVDAYLITLGSLMLIAGSFSDLFGRKKILLVGLLGFGITSLLCAIAPTALFLIISRGLQGVAGALLVPSSLALIISAFSGKAQGKAIGSWTAWTGIAFVIGPLLGGFLVDTASWRLIFAINVVPIAMTLGLMRFLKLPEQIRSTTKVDIVGAILCTVGLGGPVYALIEQSHYGWVSPMIYLPLVVGLAAIAAFVWYERRASHPMLPLSLFAVRNFAVGNLATVAIYGGLSVVGFLLTVFLQQTVHYSAIAAGLALLPVTLIMFGLSSRFGALSSRFGPRLFMALGPIVAGCGFLLLLRVGQSADYWTQVLPGVLVFGLGLTLTVAPLTAAVLGSIDAKQAGIGSAINNAVARIAGLVAIAAIGLVTGATLDIGGFHNGLIAMAALLIIGGVISAVGIQNPRTTS
ncbi:MAG TPA: MFS transporter [Candidatus Saccharimonadales bacterium]|jgi:EmrB/QacA subfamily drug resistance transporter|nr:MFS transporter [Candidatus Saccharimonadales bacterium]